MYGLNFCLPVQYSSGQFIIHETTNMKNNRFFKDDDTSCLGRLLLAGVDIDAIDSQYMTALLWAITSDNSYVIDFLLGRGANYLLAANGLTTLHFASLTGGIETLRVLRRHGLRRVEVNAESLPGFTPLDLAERRANVSRE